MNSSQSETVCVLCGSTQLVTFHHLIPRTCHSNKWFKKNFTRAEMKERGIGVAASHYPTGLSGGGDTTQAILMVGPDGSADLIVSCVDLGQGAKTVLAQIAAEELGIAYERVKVNNQGTDTGPLCFGSFAPNKT